MIETNERTTKENEYELLSCAINGIYKNSDLFSHQRGASNIGYKVIRKNHLILSMQNLHLGNININRKFDIGIISPAYKTYELKNTTALYIKNYLNTFIAKKMFFNATTTGASQCRRNVEWESLYKSTIHIPSEKEQEKIASLLVLIQNRIEFQVQLVETLKKYKRGLIRKYFEEKGTWKKVPFWDCVEIASSLVDPTIEPYMYMPHIGTANIEKFTGRLLPCKKAYEEGLTSGKYLFNSECIIYSKIRPELSKVAYPGFTGICSADAYPLKPKEGIMPEIIYYELLSERFVQFATKTSTRTKMPKINQEELSGFSFLIPPLEVQKKIIPFLRKFDLHLLYQEEELQNYVKIKKSLIQQLFI